MDIPQNDHGNGSVKKTIALALILAVFALNLECRKKHNLTAPTAPELTATPTPTDTGTRTLTPTWTITLTPTITATFSCGSGTGSFGNAICDDSYGTYSATRAQLFVLTVDARVVDIRLAAGSSYPVSFIAGIYADRSGYPSTLMAPPVTQVAANATEDTLNTVLIFPNPGVPLVAGNYWLAETNFASNCGWGVYTAGTGGYYFIDTGGLLPKYFPPYQYLYPNGSIVISADWVCP